ncbi:MAG TPA: hypothetical protein VHI55_02180 [Gaiellaceae bacterium]|nr:hypothetical protein [Gaiellaceae bacterium]
MRAIRKTLEDRLALQVTCGYAQLLAERLRRRDDQSAELCERFAAHVDGAASRDEQQPQRLAPLACARQRERVRGECCSGCAGCVERVIFAAQAAFRPWRAADFEHCLAAAGEEAGKTGAVLPVPSIAHARLPGACLAATRSGSR